MWRIQFCGFFFSAVWWAEIVEWEEDEKKTSSRPNHLWFRLTLTVKLDHHQWTHIKKNEEKIIRFRWDANSQHKKNQTVLNFYYWIAPKIMEEKVLSIDSFCSFLYPREVNCWGNGAELLLSICSLCPLERRIYSFLLNKKSNGASARSWIDGIRGLCRLS